MKRPNLIFFNPDQWQTDVIGHLVATDAISFRHAFCQNPVRTPSRCSFMTGLYPHVRGHRTMHHMLHREYDETNLLSELRRNGYFVWWGGKNDLVPGDDEFGQYCDVKFRPDAEFLKSTESSRSRIRTGPRGTDQPHRRSGLHRDGCASPRTHAALAGRNRRHRSPRHRPALTVRNPEGGIATLLKPGGSATLPAGLPQQSNSRPSRTSPPLSR